MLPKSHIIDLLSTVMISYYEIYHEQLSSYEFDEFINICKPCIYKLRQFSEVRLFIMYGGIEGSICP